MSKPDKRKWDEAAGVAENARQRLPVMVAEYFRQGREILAENPEPARLHALRLATKRLRYTLELFRPCYGPGFRLRMAALRRVQQLLGEANDCASAAAVLRGVSRGRSPQRLNFEQFLQQRGLAKVEEFRRDWNETFDLPGQERWWTGYLARHSRPPGRKP